MTKQIIFFIVMGGLHLCPRFGCPPLNPRGNVLSVPYRILFMKVLEAQHVDCITSRRNLNDNAISLLNNLKSF